MRRSAEQGSRGPGDRGIRGPGEQGIGRLGCQITRSPDDLVSRLIGLLLTIVLLVTVTPIAEAALSVSPSRVVLQGKPSEKKVGYFTLENQGHEPLRIVVEPEDWSGGIGGSRGTVAWLSVKPTQLTLRPKKQARVKYTVRIPDDAGGELRTQVFFTMETPPAGGAMPMRSRLGTIIYVGIEGTERIEAAITDVQGFYTASTPGIAHPDRVDFAIGIHNRGNAHIVPEGQVVIRSEKDQLTVATVRLQGGWGLLPNEQDTYHAIEHNIHLQPGRYTLDLTVFYGGDFRRPMTATKTLKAEVTPRHEFRLLE